jgi:PAS domain S-box-containing protein
MSNLDHGLLVQHFVDRLPDYAICILDTNGNVLTWNEGARAILGYAPEEIVGRHFSRFYTRPDDAIAAVKDALTRGRHETTCLHVRKDGTQVEISDVLIPLYDEQRKLAGFGNLMRGAAQAVLAAPRNVEAQAASAGPLNNEQVLVVDDDEQVRAVALRQLTSLGYRVITASNGTEALEILKRGAEIDLLFTDVVMPNGMGGRDLADQAQKLRPGIKTLFQSGYFEEALHRNGVLAESVDFIVKPYRKADLARKIRAVLHGTNTNA